MPRFAWFMLIFLLAFTACAPAATPSLPPREETRVMETVTPTPVPNRPLTLAVPDLPLQVDGLDMSPADGAVLLLTAEASSLPEGARRAPTDVVRAEMHLVPVAVAEGAVLSAESKGRVACAVLPSISRRNPDNPDELQTLTLDEAASAEGDYWVYTYDGVSQYVPKSVIRPGSLDVYLAVDRRLGADGKAYFAAVDADGHLQQVMEAVSDTPQPGKWRAAAPGEFGLKGHEALLNAPGLTGNTEKIKTEFDPDLGGEKVTVYAFTDETGAVREYPAEQIEWLAVGENTQVDEAGQAWGLVVLRNAEGQIEYAWTENKWVKVEPVKSPNGTDAVTMSAAGWQFIEVNKRLLVLDPSQNEINDQGREVVVSEAGRKYVWTENGWERDWPFPQDIAIEMEQMESLNRRWELREDGGLYVETYDGQMELWASQDAESGEWQAAGFYQQLQREYHPKEYAYGLPTYSFGEAQEILIKYGSQDPKFRPTKGVLAEIYRYNLVIKSGYVSVDRRAQKTSTHWGEFELTWRWGETTNSLDNAGFVDARVPVADGKGGWQWQETTMFNIEDPISFFGKKQGEYSFLQFTNRDGQIVVLVVQGSCIETERWSPLFTEEEDSKIFKYIPDHF